MTDRSKNIEEVLAAGTRIEEFVIERALQSGGFGVTYLAEDRSLGRRVAIKEYLPREWGGRRADGSVGPRSSSHEEDYRWGLTRFLEEARTLARLDHARIVRVHRVIEARGTAYMVMEYVEGLNLEEALRAEGPWPEARVRSLLAALLPGLELVHGAGLVHRDIKPANVMLRADGTPVLIDFGAARYAAGAHSRSLTSVLTPGYAPHEQYHQTAGKQGPWTDVYALGAVAYRALSGRTPAEAPARVESAARKQADPLSPVAQASAGEVSAEFGAAVASALALWPEDRPRDVSAWRAQWDGGSVVGSAIDAGGDAGRASSGAENLSSRGPSSQNPRILGADRRAVAAVLAVVVGVAVGIAGWVWDGNPGDTAESTSSVTVGEPLPVPGAPVSDQDSSPGDPGRDTMDTETENAADTGESVSPVAVGEPLPVPMVADVQAELARHGLYAGDIDGEWGPRTARAARAYASVLGIPAAGFDLRDPVQFADLASEEVLAGRDDLPLDCHACPEMVVIPAGTFQMGVPASTAGIDDAKPQHPVTLEAFALGRYEVTRDEYEKFATATEHVARGGCSVVGYDADADQGYSWSIDAALTWRDPGLSNRAVTRWSV